MDFDMQRAMGKSEAAGEDMAFYEIYPDDPGTDSLWRDDTPFKLCCKYSILLPVLLASRLI